jgi:hypothetical protein
MANDTTTANGSPAPAPAAMVKAPPPPPDQGGAIDVFASASNFDVAQRMAGALCRSPMVPDAYRFIAHDDKIINQERYDAARANCLIALDIASRVKASVMMVMQNLDIIHGRPSWRAQFLIGSVNSCGRFTPIRFRFGGTPGKEDWSCIAVAKDKATGEELVGTTITMAMAKAEGWTKKNGSKWLTMPEQMLRYRAAAFWTRTYAPEIALGLPTVDEVIDVHGEVVAEDVRPLPVTMHPGDAAALEAELLGKDLPTPPKSAPEVDAEPVK